MRDGLPHDGHTSGTLDTFSGASRSITPPGITCWLPDRRGAGRGLVWRLIMFTFSTTTRPSSGSTRWTGPGLPASLPAITRTLSPCLILILISLTLLQHLGCEGHDLHEVSLAQLTGDGAEDARS